MDDLDTYYDNLRNQTNNQLGLYLFCCSICVIWTVYILFFNSRVIGTVCTFFLNLYVRRYSKSVWIRISTHAFIYKYIVLCAMYSGVSYINASFVHSLQDHCPSRSCRARSCSRACTM